ncbi:hypothetical protein Tco_1068850 [Tanacetum coccineum]|uniref:Uncharacterized protein n=1 Tax=Tanacetum coccineum TaxID=301880 RepID=A0ABQ5HGT6_9ASTR
MSPGTDESRSHQRRGRQGGIRYSLVSGNHSGEWSIQVHGVAGLVMLFGIGLKPHSWSTPRNEGVYKFPPYWRTCPSSCIGMFSERLSNGSGFGIRLCIRNSQHQHLLFMNLHLVREELDVGLEADASDFRGFIELCSSSFVGG